MGLANYPAANPLPSRWIPDDDPTPRLNTSYEKS